MLGDGLSFLIKRLSLELDDEVDNMVKSLRETGCPMSQWFERMLVGGGLTRFFPIRVEMPRWSEIRV